MGLKKNKLTLGVVVVLITVIGVKLFIKSNEEFDGASISGSINGRGYGLTIGDNENFSKEDEEILKKICLSRRNGGIDINSNEVSTLGSPTNTMMMSMIYNTDLISTKVNDYNLWIGNKIGYIQNKNDDKIYKLSSEENKFFVNCFLKYHSEEEVKDMISNKF